jgi:CRISPR-associated exonuclease Cas4
MTGQVVTCGYVYYAQTHQRQPIVLSPQLRSQTITTIAVIREVMQTGRMPPAIYGPRCQGCSLYDQCLPQAVNKVNRYQELE